MHSIDHTSTASSGAGQTRIALLVAVLLTMMPAASAQTPSTTAPQTPGQNWERVKALPSQTRVHITTDHGTKNCGIFSVTDDVLTCSGKHGAGLEIQRTEVQRIKLVHPVRSALLGAGLGGGTGAVLGGITGRSKPCPTAQAFCLSGIGIGDGGAAAIVGAAGAILGGVVGGTTDFARGSAIYTRP